MTIKHNDIETILPFDGDDAMDGLDMLDMARFQVERRYPGSVARCSRADGDHIFVWYHKLGLVLHAEVHWLPASESRVIRVYPMTRVHPYGYQVATLLFASEIGQRIHDICRVGRKAAISANAHECDRYRRSAY